MTEIPEAGRGVTFTELRPIDFVVPPGNALADFLPMDTAEIHLVIDEILADPNHLDAFMAIELGPEPLPWTDGWMYPEDIEQVKDWSEGFKDKLGFLGRVQTFIEPGSIVSITSKEADFIVRNAVAVYLEMVDLAATSNGWTEADLLDARAKVLAELTMPDKDRAWRDWNNRAMEYTNRKLMRLNAILRQPAA